MAERVIEDLLREKVSYVILRPVMIFGPGDRGNMARMIDGIKRGRFVLPGPGSNKKSAIYAIGWLDDKRGLSPLLRAFFHVAAAVWALSLMGGFPGVDLYDHRQGQARHNAAGINPGLGRGEH